MDPIGIAASLASALGWAICIGCFTYSLSQLPAKGAIHIMNLYRVSFAALGCFGSYLFLQGEIQVPDVSLYQTGLIVLGGLITLVFTDTCLYVGCLALGAGYATLLFSTYPIVTTLLAWMFYGQVLGWVSWLGILITFLGIAWVNVERNKGPTRESLRGVFFALLASTGQAIGFLILMPVMSGENALDPALVNLGRFAVAIVGFSLIAIQQKIVRSFFQSFTIKSAMIWIVIGSVIGNVLASWFSLIPFSEEHAIPAGVATTLMSTTPIMILPLVAFGPQAIREKVTAKVWAGVSIAVAGVAIILNSARVFTP